MEANARSVIFYPGIGWRAGSLQAKTLRELVQKHGITVADYYPDGYPIDLQYEMEKRPDPFCGEKHSFQKLYARHGSVVQSKMSSQFSKKQTAAPKEKVAPTLSSDMLARAAVVRSVISKAGRPKRVRSPNVRGPKKQFDLPALRQAERQNKVKARRGFSDNDILIWLKENGDKRLDAANHFGCSKNTINGIIFRSRKEAEALSVV